MSHADLPKIVEDSSTVCRLSTADQQLRAGQVQLASACPNSWDSIVQIDLFFPWLRSQNIAVPQRERLMHSTQVGKVPWLPWVPKVVVV